MIARWESAKTMRYVLPAGDHAGERRPESLDHGRGDIGAE
jgi:hypothetical protein